MPAFTQTTLNQGWSTHPLTTNDPGGALGFMRRRARGPWGGSLIETGLNIMSFGTWGVGWSLGWGAASLPLEAAHTMVRGVQALERLGRSALEYGTPVVDTRMAYTMRQAALSAMHNSAYSLRAVVGNEARFLHS